MAMLFDRLFHVRAHHQALAASVYLVRSHYYNYSRTLKTLLPCLLIYNYSYIYNYKSKSISLLLFVIVWLLES